MPPIVACFFFVTPFDLRFGAVLRISCNPQLLSPLCTPEQLNKLIPLLED